MLAWAVAVSLVLVLLLIWSALYQKGLLSRRDADSGAPAEGAPEGASEPSAGKGRNAPV
jgi:hypothetical protein